MTSLESTIFSIKAYAADNVFYVMAGCAISATLVIGYLLAPAWTPLFVEYFGNRPTTPARPFFHCCPKRVVTSPNHTLAYYRYTQARVPVQQMNLLAADAAPFRNYHRSVLIDWANQIFRENGTVVRLTFSNNNPFIADLLDARFDQYPDVLPFDDRAEMAFNDVWRSCASRDVSQCNLNNHAFAGIESYREEVFPAYREFKASLNTRRR